MQIRHARPEDLPAMQEIFADARAFMRENGNPDQWGDRFPTQEMIDRDLALHRSYVCEDNGKIAATFAFTTDGEPTYRVIRGGAWAGRCARTALSTVSRRQRARTAQLRSA